MQAEHGQVLVVAASHLIFLLRQPSQALITEQGTCQHAKSSFDTKWRRRTFQPLMAVMLIHENIICE